MRDTLRHVPWRTSSLYALVAATWILASDTLLHAVVSDQSFADLLAIYKGWAFVGVTAALLYLVLTAQLRRFEREMAGRERAETQLQASEARFRSLLECAGEGIYGLDANGHATFVNPSAVGMLSYPAGELIGQKMHDLVHHSRADGSPYPPAQCPVQASLRDGETRHVDDEVLWRKDRVSFPVEYIVTSLRNSRTGRPDGVVVTFGDRTERKLAVERLRASLAENANLRAALDEHAIVAITDAQGRITYVNDKFCTISKYSRQELLGRDHRIVNSGHHPKEFMGDLWTTIARGQVWQGDMKNRAKDGSFYWVATTIVPFLDDMGRPHQYVTIHADVTERRRAEEEVQRLNADLEKRVAQRTAELEVANNELEAFSYSISHDLRAPLRAVNGFATIVLDEFGASLPEDGRQYLEKICNGGKRMSQLIDDLLAFSRLSRQPLTLRDIDTLELVGEVIDELRAQHDGRQIEIRVGDLPPCQGDPALLKQVWVNLVSNAIKYTRGREPAIIEIGCARDDGRSVYFVRDNGTGFDMQHAGKLFGVFQRLHPADQFEGTGVGLAIVQRVVLRHGGSVWTDAEAGRGATFHFVLQGPSSPG
jgi:PAS domain S-box-containing protein